MGWRGYIHDDSKTVFFWSQKAACTTLFNFLADNMPERPTNKRYFHINSRPYNPCIEAIRDHGYHSVILARHPVTRVISAYFNKFCVYRGKALQVREDLEPFARELHDLWCDREGNPTETNSMTFEDFLETIAHMLATRPAPHLPVNGHWETQIPAIHEKLGLHYDTVVHVENLNAEMAALAQARGLSYKPRAMNRTDLSESPHKGYLGNLPACEINTYNFGYDNFITRKTLKKIHAIYAVDFEVLDYPSDQRTGPVMGHILRQLRGIRAYSSRFTGK